MPGTNTLAYFAGSVDVEKCFISLPADEKWTQDGDDGISGENLKIKNIKGWNSPNCDNVYFPVSISFCFVIVDNSNISL